MNLYHAIIERSEATQPNQHAMFEAETIEQATGFFHAKNGTEAVLKVWQDYFDANEVRTLKRVILGESVEFGKERGR